MSDGRQLGNGSADGSRRDELVTRARQVRTRLMHTIEQLDQKRHDALDLKLQVQRHLVTAAVAAGALVLVTGGLAALLVHRIQTAAERRRRARWRLAKDLWRHPQDRLRSREPSFVLRVLRSLLLSVVTAAVTIPARRVVRRALAERTAG